ncbi:MAG: U32 family peptidase [Spirochaetaceae bacterium]|nr:MAG: U32 family peptidase [Spirochaetaceae bacterium]
MVLAERADLPYTAAAMSRPTPEIYAPGGSFHSALAAFDAGADTVYLGLAEFSARKAAANFSFDQLRRIRSVAADRGKRIAVTVNTVVRDAEIGRLVDALGRIEAIGVDAIVVQDLAVSEIAARLFPRLELHASTQMAIHNSAGLTAAASLGFRRVVLARELPLISIRRLRAEHPEVEFEVFIHGALCYSFSGLCLASWALTGRSGNRGECAQICRGHFESRESGEAGHLFSARDLALRRSVLDLADAGVDALKIEGRMKSPEYVYHTVRLYREILDRRDELSHDQERELARRSTLAFARESTSAYFGSPSGERLVDRYHDGHWGAPLGSIVTVGRDDVTLLLDHDISLRDGIGLFPDLSGTAGETEPLRFSARRIRCAGRSVTRASAGETVSIELPPGMRPPRGPGCEVRHLSSRELDLTAPNEAAFPLYRIPIKLDVELSQNLTVRASLAPGCVVTTSHDVTIDDAKVRRPFADLIRSVLSESGESLFRPESIVFTNNCGRSDDAIFIPPSELKRAKNEFYRVLDESFERCTTDRVADIPALLAPPQPTAAGDRPDAARLSAFGDRDSVSPGNRVIPFVSLVRGAIDRTALAVVAGYTCVPLPPVMLDDVAWTRALVDVVTSAPDVRFAVGVANVAHLVVAEALRACENAWFFVDFPIYVANRHTAELLARRLPRLLFAYSWIEEAEPSSIPGPAPAPGPAAVGGAAPRDGASPGDPSPGLPPMLRVQPGFSPPLFLSLGCYAKHTLFAGLCPDEAARRRDPTALSASRAGSRAASTCPRYFDHEISQRANRYRVVVRDCVTYVTKVEV